MDNFAGKIEALLAWGGLKRDVIFLSVSAVGIGLSLLGWEVLPFDGAWLAIVLCGVPIVAGAAAALLTRFDIRADVLVSLALVASLAIGEVFAAGEVAFIMQLGALLEELTTARARAGIERLVKLTPTTARRVEGAGESIIEASLVEVGDVLRVRPGETVPADGVIVAGRTSINQALLSGESLPVDKEAGDEVAGGTVNAFGAFEMRVTKAYADSSIQRMIRLVQSADAGKAKIVRLADRWATRIVLAALTTALLTWLVTGEAIRAVTVLVVFCPCALVLATPAAVTAAMGNAARHGFLVKEGDALERLASVRRVAFDKTGTLTYGRLTLAQLRSFEEGLSSTALLKLAASAESLSEHPLGRAVVAAAREWTEREPATPEKFSLLPGLGVEAEVGGRKITVGSVRLFKMRGIAIMGEAAQLMAEAAGKGEAVILVASEGRLVGLISLADTLREGAGAMLRSLEALGLRPMLLTGDSEAAARSLAAGLDLSERHAACLPEDKLEIIDKYQARGEAVCMIGDGINDAPALKRAHVGIAMGGAGSDIAADAADIALTDDAIGKLPHLAALSRRMMVTIKRNLAFSLALNFAAIVLAATGELSPVLGALVHNAGSVLVVINSALLLKWRGPWAKDFSMTPQREPACCLEQGEK